MEITDGEGSMSEAKSIRISILKMGYMINTTLLLTEDAYACETRESLHKKLDEILDKEKAST